MARAIAKRYRVTGTLVAESPLHVGGYGEAIEADLPVARNGADQCVIPGTSLAGALRAWHLWACDAGWDGHAVGSVPGGQGFVDQLWGFTPGRGKDSKQGTASFVIVEDAPVTAPGRLEIRDSVGIDRVEGRAADGIKYDRQILPQGARIALDLTVEVPAATDTAAAASREAGVRAALGHLLAALEAGAVRLGAARTRGLGRVRLAPGYRVEAQDLTSRAGMLAVLQGRSTAIPTAADLLVGLPNGLTPRPRPRLEIAVEWEPDGPVMVKADAAGIAVDMLPLTGVTGDRLALVIPGASIKGALRAQAERIAATVLDVSLEDAANRPASRERFLNQLARCDLVETLFGAPGRPKTTDQDRTRNTDRHPQPGLGALAVEDCFAEPLFCPDDWQAVLSAGAGRDDHSQGPLLEALKTAGLTQSQPVTHVAIDRWTGGAAESLLYSVLEPHGIRWPAMRLSVNLTRLAHPGDEPAGGPADKPQHEQNGTAAPPSDADRRTRRLAALALLLLTLRDLARQRIPIGFAGNRGMGTIKVTRIAVAASADGDEASGFAQEIEALTDLSLDVRDWQQPSDALRERWQPLQDAWTAYCDQNRNGGRT